MPIRSLIARLKVGSAAIVMLASSLAGCATVSAVDIPRMAQPAMAPVAQSTSFDDALTCMDRQFADYGVKGVVILSARVPDLTGRAPVGSDRWLEAAMARMSTRSHAFEIEDYDASGVAPESVIWNWLQDHSAFVVPNYYITGAISGISDPIATQGATGSVAGIRFDAGGGAQKSFSTISVNVSVKDFEKRTLVGRALSGNDVVLKSSEAGGQLGGNIAKFGVDFEFSGSRNEGVPQAVHALIDLSAIETLGRLVGTPYWVCLKGTSQAAIGETRRDLFENMSEIDRTIFVQRRLWRLGVYPGPIDGERSTALAQAIKSYGAARGLTASTPDDFDLYARMTDWRADPAPASVARPLPPAPQVAAAAPEPKPAAAAPAAAAPAAPKPAPDAPAKPAAAPSQLVVPKMDQLTLTLVLVGQPAPNTPMQFQLKSNSIAYAACYLEDQHGAIARVFPNRWQADPLVRKDAAIDLPSPKAGFDLLPPPAGKQERLACFASRQNLAPLLPKNLQGIADLQPLPATTLTKLAKVYSDASGGDIAATMHTLTPAPPR